MLLVFVIYYIDCVQGDNKRCKFYSNKVICHDTPHFETKIEINQNIYCHPNCYFVLYKFILPKIYVCLVLLSSDLL